MQRGAEVRALRRGKSAMIKGIIVAPALMAVPVQADELKRVPYSCRELYDEQKKCAFGSCDKRVIERLTKECLRDGGRP